MAKSLDMTAWEAEQTYQLPSTAANGPKRLPWGWCSVLRSAVGKAWKTLCHIQHPWMTFWTLTSPCPSSGKSGSHQNPRRMVRRDQWSGLALLLLPLIQQASTMNQFVLNTMLGMWWLTRDWGIPCKLSSNLSIPLATSRDRPLTPVSGGAAGWIAVSAEPKCVFCPWDDSELEPVHITFQSRRFGLA